jgi:hypothetical protein
MPDQPLWPPQSLAPIPRSHFFSHLFIEPAIFIWPVNERPSLCTLYAAKQEMMATGNDLDLRGEGGI